jgi:hypothetical protein
MASENQVLITGIIKDAETTLTKDMERLNSAFAGFSKISWFLVESNSVDRTREILFQIKESNLDFNFVSLDQNMLNDTSRTVALAEARNRYLAEVIRNPNYKKIDFVVVSDFNNLNSSLTKLAVDSCFEGEIAWDVCCANQSGPYYDIWALRHPLWSPNDCWEAHAFFRKQTFFPEVALIKAVNSRMIRIKQTSEWIEVDSAFGGLAIYKRSVFIKGEYAGLTPDLRPICEHVPFNISLRSQGAKIFINPRLINFSRTDHSIRSGAIHRIIRILKYPYKLIRSVMNS